MFRKALIFLVAGVILLFVPFCPEKDILRLKGGEVAKVLFNGRTGQVDIVQDPAGGNPGRTSGIFRKRILGGRKSEIVLDRTGKLTVTSSPKGFTFEPGLFWGFNGGSCPGVGVQFAYWHQIGLFGGSYYSFRDKEIQAFLGAGYTFERFQNTSLLLGMNTDKKIVIGAEIRF